MANMDIWLLTALIIISIVALLFGLFIYCGRFNRADWGGVWINRLDGLNRLFCHRFHRLSYTEIPLPEQGGALVVCNHVSGLDPLLMIAACNRPLRFMIAREEYERFGFTWLFKGIGCIPVERTARPEKALREALKVINNGEVVAMFPHGRIHTETFPPRKLKAGVHWLAQQTQAPILPLRLTGVGGEGRTVTALLIRSNAKLQAGELMDVTSMEKEACMDHISLFFHGTLH